MEQSTIDDIDKWDVFNTLLNTLAVMVFVNVGSKIIWANDAFFNISGYTKDELDNISFVDLFDPRNSKLYLKRTEERLKEGEGLPKYYSNIEVLKKNGEILHVDVYPDTIEYMGSPATIYIIVDKTDQRKTEKILEEFFLYCPVTLTIKDKNHRYIKISDSYANNIKKHPFNVIGKTNREVWPPDISERMDKNESYVYDNKKKLTFEEPINGVNHLTTVFPINGDLLGKVSVDISDKLLLNEKIEENAKLFTIITTLLDGMDQMMWLYEKENDFIFINKPFRDFGVSEDFFGQCRCTMDMETKETIIIPRTINGEEKYLEMEKIPIYDDNKNVIGCSGRVKDVTEFMEQKIDILNGIEIIKEETEKSFKVSDDLMVTLNKITSRWSNNG